MALLGETTMDGVEQVRFQRVELNAVRTRRAPLRIIWLLCHPRTYLPSGLAHSEDPALQVGNSPLLVLSGGSKYRDKKPLRSISLSQRATA
jgi:hypothetical protein